MVKSNEGVQKDNILHINNLALDDCMMSFSDRQLAASSLVVISVQISNSWWIEIHCPNLPVKLLGTSLWICLKFTTTVQLYKSTVNTTSCCSKLVCKQLPVYTSSRYGATLAFIWSPVSSHLVNVSPISTPFFRFPGCLAAKCSIMLAS